MHADVLTSLKIAIETAKVKNIKDYLDNKGIDEKPIDVRKQMTDQFGEEAMKPIMAKIRENMQANGPGVKRLEMIVTNLLSRPTVTEDECDKIIGNLNTCIAKVLEKKNQIN